MGGFEDKAPEIQDFLEHMFGTRTALEQNVCVFCGKPAVKFRNEISLREYNISGLCQECQDKTFGVD